VFFFQLEKINNDENYKKSILNRQQSRQRDDLKYSSSLSRLRDTSISTTMPSSGATVDADNLNHNTIRDEAEPPVVKSTQDHHSSKRSLHSNKMQLNVMGKLKDRQGVPV
jgi:hypothetical protein